MLVGAREGTAIRMGDPVSVSVDSIEAPRGRVDLVPVQRSDGEAPGGGRPRQVKGGSRERAGAAVTRPRKGRGR